MEKEKYFDNLDDLAKWASSNQIDSISIDAHKCLSVNGSIRFGLTCVAQGKIADQLLNGRFNTNKFTDRKLIDVEAEKIESKLRSYGFVVDRLTLPV
jgi:hypothetical protein